ncbi:MAG: asparagine synthase (glutamine-hydrolyzing) [Legionellaceae bacterium]|nr:asparagine synthase (glutamine-hydrolyzing) [Legionellaceae bacterium]
MCGLTGFFNSRETTDRMTSMISTMTERLTHRGPDGSGIWCHHDDAIALGHRRLAILDLTSSGQQPMHSHDDRYVIVFNGEIYNYLELKKQLQTKHHTFSGRSDTEVILALILEYGLEVTLHRLTGMFAFALWDKKDKILHLARDRVGEKPLYYGMINNTFVFGSELKAMRLYPEFQNKIARSSIALFMQYGYIPAPHSIYENIHKLTPGTFLTVTKSILQNKLIPKVYWSAAQIAEEGLASPLLISDTDAIEQTEQLLNTIITGQMISDVPIGAFLSGGVDSSLVAAMMQTNSKQPIKTFTIGFEIDAYNEADYAKAIAQHLRTDHTELYVNAQHAIDVIPKLPGIYDEPFADSSAIPTYLIAQLTSQQVRVCLSGDGGDELFGGYNRYRLGQSIWKKISLLPYPLRLAVQKLLLSMSPTRLHDVLKFLNIPMIGDKLHKFASVIAANSPEQLYQYFISQWHSPHNVLVSHPENSASMPILLHQLQGMHFIEKMMITDTLSYLPDDIMVKVDRAGMANGLENRAPFLNHQLIEFIWRLPLNMKVRNHTTKWLLRQVLEKYVPKALFDRPKMGFGVPLDTWLRGPLRDWADALLDKQKIEKQGFLQADRIATTWQEHLSGKRNWQYQLWTVLMFQAWIEHEKYT